jgi:hypothetical protein
VNRMEDRLRDAFGAAAGTVRADKIRGLPSRPPSPPGRRWLVPLAAAAAVAVVIAAVFVVTPLVLSGHRGPATSQPRSASSTHVAPSPRPSARFTVGRCVHVTATGDFDGDGTPDVATLVDVLPAGQTCRQDLSDHLRIRVTFGSGGGFDRPFTYCTGGACDSVFTATDLAGDGRSELAVEVGPGAAIDFVEFFRVGRHGISPLRITAAGTAKAGLKPGPAVFGGSQDSGVQSPVACHIRPDGSRVLVSIQAESLSSRITGPWRVKRTDLQLRGDSLHVVGVSTATVRGFPVRSLRFHNGCP